MEGILMPEMLIKESKTEESIMYLCYCVLGSA